MEIGKEKWKSLKKYRVTFFIVAFILGAIQAWATRNFMNSDGLSYIDIAVNYLNGNYEEAFNTYWSPFYSWVIAIALFIFKPTPYWEFTVVHIVNFIAYILSFIAFDFFMKEVVLLHERITEQQKNQYQRLSLTSLLLLGYTLFLWISLKFVTIWVVTPDMFLTVFLYLGYALLISINRKPSKKKFFLMAIILGLAYPIKPIILWIGVFFHIGAVFATKNYKKYLATGIISLIIFFISASPLVISMSLHNKRITYAENVRLMMLWEVNQIKPYYMVHWQGEALGYGTPVHPTRKINERPTIYEFGSPVSGTYPPWYDPTYWHEGVKPKTSLSEMIKPFKVHIVDYLFIYLIMQGILILGVFYLLAKSEKVWLSVLKSQFYYFIPTVLTLAMISMVLPELRYLSSYVVAFWLAMYICVSINKDIPSKGLIKRVVTYVCVLMLFVTLAAKFYKSDYCYVENLVKTIQGEKYYNHVTLRVYEKLKEEGLKKGDKVAVVGHGFFSFWAHFGGQKVVAEIPTEEVEYFWSLNDGEKEKVYKVFASTGAKILLTEKIPEKISKYGWTNVPKTKYYYKKLN